MKDIIELGKRLMSMFLVLVVSSMMYLLYPAVTANSSIDVDALNKDNTKTQILKSDKPVKVSKPDEATVILTPQEAVRQANSPVKKRESENKSLFDDLTTAKDTAPSR
ncbi:hypothetical protein NIES4071_96700 [Calothrix sp. NIES-4071]|nr:hypothetical protein NIES4071_96700 [Calothrix sp. NIES-4071]BAZ63935.1 hypothetical protein NIES4105_96630 [Calothrix sp. NIES-4105]